MLVTLGTEVFALDLESTHSATPQQDSAFHAPTHTPIHLQLTRNFNSFFILSTHPNTHSPSQFLMPIMRYSIQAMMCLVFIFGVSIAGAWNAEFFSEELGCGDADASAKSTSLEYVGPDLDDTLIPQLMPCLDLGGTIEDPLVNCTAHLDPALTETGDVRDSFVKTYFFSFLFLPECVLIYLRPCSVMAMPTL